MTMTMNSFATNLQASLASVDKTKMTVKQFLELQSQIFIETIEKEAQAGNADLDIKWKAAEMELQKMQRLAAEKFNNYDDDRSTNDDDSSVASGVSGAVVEDKKTRVMTSKMASLTKSSTAIVRVEVLSGPHLGQIFEVKPRVRYHSWIGRSTGQKFTRNGISLCNDQEVSTAHGKIFIKAKKLYYSDQGSTNGSFLMEGNTEIELMPDYLQELKDGTIIRVGLTNLKISV